MLNTVMAANERRRAVHDFNDGTMVVKEIYIDKIRETINTGKNKNKLN